MYICIYVYILTIYISILTIMHAIICYFILFQTDFVSPLDIALQNNDHHLIDVLQRFGAKTGHRIVDNAALVIQNQWRVFKHRFSATVSVYPSNFSDSISIREGAEFRRLESDAQQDSRSVAKGEKFVDDITYNSECLGDDETEDDSQSIISKLEQESLNCSFDAEEGALFARNVELDQIHQLKIETVERIRLSVSLSICDFIFQLIRQMKQNPIPPIESSIS